MKPPSGLMNSGNKKMARGKRRLVSRLIRGRHSRSRTTILLCLNLRWQLYQYCYSSFCLTYTNKGIYTDPVARPWAHPRQHPWPWPLVCPFSGFRLTVGDVPWTPIVGHPVANGWSWMALHATSEMHCPSRIVEPNYFISVPYPILKAMLYK